MTSSVWPPRSADEYWQEAVDHLGPERATLFASVHALIFDADGVMTPGNLIFGPEGEALKEFDSRDGLGLVMARIVGLKRAVITGRSSQIVATRARELKFDAIRVGRFDKAAALQETLAELGCSAQQSLYMGDDLVDLPALLRVAVPVTVPDAPGEVLEHCCYVTTAAGGHGAIREVVDLVLKCRRQYTEALVGLDQGAGQPPRGGEL